MEKIAANQVISETQVTTITATEGAISNCSNSPESYPTNKFRYKRYRFGADIRREIARLHQLDNWHGLLMVLEDWSYIIGTASISIWAWNTQSLYLAIPIYLLTIAVIGARQRGLRVVNHIGTHKALAKNRTLNYLLSTVTAAWLVLESFSGYDDTHNSYQNGHHPNLGTTLDVDHMAVVQQGLYGEGKTTDKLRKYLWSIPLKTPGYVMFLLKNRVWNSKESKKERSIRLLFLTALIGLISYMGCSSIILLYWVVPLFTTAIWVGLFVQLAEHYPLMEMDYDIDIYVSRNRILHPIANLFVGTHHEGYHLIHHLFPGLPFWRMKQAHRILMLDATYASLHQEAGLKALIKQITPA